MAPYQNWRQDALMDVQRMINRTLHLAPRYPGNSTHRSSHLQAETALAHPFKVTVSGDKCLVSGGYVMGYMDKKQVADTAFPADGAAFVYLAVTPNATDQTIQVRIECGAKHDYVENDVYYFPVAEIADGKVIQYQFSSLITPFRKNYIPVIDTSLQCLLKVKEGEGDEMKFMLQDGPQGPNGNQHLCTKKNGDLYWHLCKKDDDDSSSSSSTDSTVPVPPASSSSTVPDELIPDKWYVFVRYYRNEGDTEVQYNGYRYNKPETFHTEGWGTEIGQWVEDVYDMGDGMTFTAGYYYNAVAGGPFETVLEADAWWRENEYKYDPLVEAPQ